MKKEFYDFLRNLESKGFNIIKFNFYKGKLLVIASKGKEVFIFNYEKQER